MPTLLARAAKTQFNPSLSSASSEKLTRPTKQSISPRMPRYGLLRFARNDDDKKAGIAPGLFDFRFPQGCRSDATLTAMLSASAFISGK